MFKTGDRVEVIHGSPTDPAYWGLEGKIVAWVPRWINRPSYINSAVHRLPHPGDFYIHFDTPPLGPYGASMADRVHQGGPWNPEWVKPVPPEMTIGEIADLFGVDPYEIAVAALKEDE